MKKAGQKKRVKAPARPRPTVAQVTELQRQLKDATVRLNVRSEMLERERKLAASADAKALELRRQLNQATADNEGMRRELADWRRRGGADVVIRQELEQTVDQLRGVKQRALGLGKQLAEWFSKNGPVVTDADAIGHDVGIVMHRLAALLEGAPAQAPRGPIEERLVKLEHRIGYQAEALNELARMHDRQRENVKHELRELEQQLNNLCTVGTADGRVPASHTNGYRTAELVPGGTPV